MNKKGFVLTETLVVTIFVLLIFTILYNTAVPLLGRYEEISYYDDLDTTYDVYQYKRLLEYDKKYISILNNNYKKLSCNDFDNLVECDKIDDILGITNNDTLLYLKSNYINEVKNDSNISDSIKDYLSYLNLDENINILLLEKNNYISYVKLGSSKVIDSNSLKELVINKLCNGVPAYEEENGIIYISGYNECIDFNYLWYSGKLWRITAFYPNGSMKLVTEKGITTIPWGDREYAASWVFQWLNEDFFDTLKDPEEVIVTDQVWTYTKDDSESVKEENAAIRKTITAPVGLLSYHETFFGRNGGYLTNGYNWYTISSFYSNNSNHGVSSSGGHYAGSVNVSFSVRPSIYLKSDVVLNGDGTKSNPYILSDDKFQSAKINDLLNTRNSGEYVNFNNDLYRIVNIEGGVTKLTKVDYLRNNQSSENPKPILIKKFASTYCYGKSGNSLSDEYIDYYLNNTWYNSITSNYKNMINPGIFYLGECSNCNYKKTICKDNDTNLDNLIIKNGESNSCTRYTSSDADKTYTGYVGLPRIGEMFASQQGNGYATSSDFWLITPYKKNNKYDAIVNSINPEEPYAIRPSFFVKSSVKITGGSGLEADPYIIS